MFYTRTIFGSGFFVQIRSQPIYCVDFVGCDVACRVKRTRPCEPPDSRFRELSGYENVHPICRLTAPVCTAVGNYSRRKADRTITLRLSCARVSGAWPPRGLRELEPTRFDTPASSPLPLMRPRFHSSFSR